MKLLIRISINNVNIYDLKQIINVVHFSISDKLDTYVSLIGDDPEIAKIEYGNYFKGTSVPESINYKLSEYQWDLVLPITKPVVINRNFDTNIKNIYKNQFKNLDGVLWMNDGIMEDINEYPVIGREYYNKFGYIYNPIYKEKNYKEEFSEILKINKKFFFYNAKLFKNINIKLDDDNIYNLRKGINFGIT